MRRGIHHRELQPHVLFTLAVATILSVLFLLLAPSAGHSHVISGCGEEVAAGDVAYLTADLDCRGSGSEGVVLSDGSRLVMGGHSIVGDPDDEGGPWQGVRCKTGTVCTVDGPGSIVGFSASGVAGTRVRVRDVVIAGNGRSGVAAYENVVLHDVVIADNGSGAVHAGGRVKLRRSTATVLLAGPGSDVREDRAPLYRPDRGPR